MRVRLGVPLRALWPSSSSVHAPGGEARLAPAEEPAAGAHGATPRHFARSRHGHRVRLRVAWRARMRCAPDSGGNAQQACDRRRRHAGNQDSVGLAADRRRRNQPRWAVSEAAARRPQPPVGRLPLHLRHRRLLRCQHARPRVALQGRQHPPAPARTRPQTPALASTSAYARCVTRGSGTGAAGEKCFYPSVPIIFEIEATNEHYHIPLLINKFGFSTYRGS